MPLDPSRPYKPLDVGNGLVAGSVATDGRVLSLLTYDSDHGAVILTAVPPFDERKRRNQAAVRAYRASLADPARPGFGLHLDAPLRRWRVALLSDLVPEARAEMDGVRVAVTTWAPPGQRGIAQRWRIETKRPVRWRCPPPLLRRADYTQLTEGGPLRPAGAIARRSVVFGVDGDRGELPRGDHELVLRIGFDRVIDVAPLAFAQLPGNTTVSRRGLAYARIVSLATQHDAVCILADHEILPLSWNRDAYYVATLLRSLGEVEVVRAHLRWLFRVAERDKGLWGRAHLANGRIKDHAYQLDQQCYPLLEAVEAAQTDDYRADIAAVVRAIEARREGELYPTEETPGDDPLSLRFHFSSHVLLWRTLAALRDAGFDVDAERVRRVTLRAFADTGRFAYATDGNGQFRHYHDANDVPTALAPEWGFCAADDPRWRATIDFAWSEANAGGFYPGPLAGLGSVHTPHAWTLGDLQDVIVARALGDAARERRARDKLSRVETWDGMLPEAYDERTGEVRSRHWFAWPVALRAILDG